MENALFSHIVINNTIYEKEDFFFNDETIPLLDLKYIDNESFINNEMFIEKNENTIYNNNYQTINYFNKSNIKSYVFNNKSYIDNKKNKILSNKYIDLNINHINNEKEIVNENKSNIIFIINKIPHKNKFKENKEKKIYKCICGKKYNSKENQILHFRNIHLNKKPYECSFCKNKFSHRNGKTYHERIFHTFIFPYKCNISKCTKCFASKSSLNYHIKNKH